MAKYLLMPSTKNNQDLTPGSPMLGLSVGPTSILESESETGIAVCQEQSGPYSWFPDAWIKRGTHFTFRERKRNRDCRLPRTIRTLLLVPRCLD
ncbi:hypothetical protein PoB_000927400 [Plakobranchus ocellatus]|uniref:Uncharacterized protein n=1 Tax=Plakobranchus ocellatus TaxID=259542 RepID=A0AAV3YIE3_9GAST|nr:hypothetical protein PoB_000927400 [Plakobranchus ocellatus]